MAADYRGSWVWPRFTLASKALRFDLVAIKYRVVRAAVILIARAPSQDACGSSR